MKYIKYTMMNFDLVQYSDACSLTEILLDSRKRCLIRGKTTFMIDF